MSNGCPKCDEYRDRGTPFCGACGRNLNDAGSEEPSFGHYSNSHGYPAAEPEKPRLDLITFILLAATVFVIFIAVFEAITLAVNAPEVFGFLSGKSYPAFVLVPSIHILFFWDDFELQLYWILLAVVILSCVTTTIVRFFEVARSPGGLAKPGAAEKTAAFWVCIFLCAMLIINFIAIFIVLMMGHEISVPPLGGKLADMFELANASVWEEVVTRVLYIGVPIAFISLVAGKKDSLKCIFGGFGMSTTAIVLIIISSAIFGLAHYDGWDNQVWKVLTTGIMGVFLGYLFVRFGLYAAILFHFITDYFQAFDWMGVGGFFVVVELLLLAVGFVALIYIIMKIIDSKKSIRSLPLLHD